MEALAQYAWPGNVRELRNVVERLLLFAVDGKVNLASVSMALPQQNVSAANAGSATEGPLAERVGQFERETILAELKRQQFHITNAARALGLERSHLYKKCQQLGIDLRTLRGGGP